MKIGPKKKYLNLLDALGDKNRLGIVLFLAGGEKCVCEITQCLGLPQNLVSHHLGVLRKRDLISSHKEGKWVYYSLNKEAVKKLQGFFGDIHCCCCGKPARKNKIKK